MRSNSIQSGQVSLQQMAIMRKAGREGWAIVEAEGLAVLALADRLLESIDVAPILQHSLLLARELEAPSQVVLWKDGIRVQGSHSVRESFFAAGQRARRLQSSVCTQASRWNTSQESNLPSGPRASKNVRRGRLQERCCENQIDKEASLAM